MSETQTILNHDTVISFPTVYPQYAMAASVARKLGDDDVTLETGWYYAVSAYRGGYAVAVIDDDGQFVGRL